MTRTFEKKDFSKGYSVIICTVTDHDTLVAVFTAGCKGSHVVALKSELHSAGYNLLSEHRLFLARLSSILDGSVTCEQYSRICGPLFDAF